MTVKGYIYITETGYDPQHGKHLEDPYLDDVPTLGACMPNIRRQVSPGDHIFIISGKVRQAPQLVLGGFEVAEKLDSMVEAFDRFPSLRLHRGENGRPQGNIVVESDGRQHPLDTHPSDTFQERIRNYIVGKNLIVLKSRAEMALGREETLPILCQTLGRNGPTPIKVVGRWSRLDGDQVLSIRDWLEDLRIRADLGRVA